MYNEIRAPSYLFVFPAQYFRAISGGWRVLNIRCRINYKCIIVMHWGSDQAACSVALSLDPGCAVEATLEMISVPPVPSVRILVGRVIQG